jgi:hypothetical protein
MSNRSTTNLGACIVALALAAGSVPALAQGTTGSGTGGASTPRATATDTTAARTEQRDDGFDWGWLGLLGLAGLAGLRRQQPTTYDRSSTTAR